MFKIVMYACRARPVCRVKLLYFDQNAWLPPVKFRYVISKSILFWLFLFLRLRVAHREMGF